MENNPKYPATPKVITAKNDTSPLSIAEKAIAEKLNTITELRYVGDDYGQLDYYENHPPVSFPCVLIDTSEADYENIGQNRYKKPQNRQNATCTLSLLIADIRLTNSTITGRANIAVNPTPIKEIVQLVHNELHGWSPSAQSSRLQRIRQRRQKRNDGVIAYELYYIFAMNDV